MTSSRAPHSIAASLAASVAASFAAAPAAALAAALLLAAPALAAPGDPVEPQSWRGEAIRMGGTIEGDALAGASEAFHQVAAAWRANDARRASMALQLGRRWLNNVPRPEVAALDERASRLGQDIALRTLDVIPGAEALARDAKLLSDRLGGSVVTPWATTRPTRTPTPQPAIVAPVGAPGAPVKRPPGMYHR